jgi:hypothetical protein
MDRRSLFLARTFGSQLYSWDIEDLSVHRGGFKKSLLATPTAILLGRFDTFLRFVSGFSLESRFGGFVHSGFVFLFWERGMTLRESNYKCCLPEAIYSREVF